MEKPKDIKRILVTRSARMKEVNFGVDDLKSKFPNSTITVLAQPQVKEELTKNENVDEVVLYDKGKFNIFRMGFKGIKDIRQKEFDLIAIIYNHPSGKGYLHLDLLAYLSGAKEKIYYSIFGHSFRYSLLGLLFRMIRIPILIGSSLFLPLLFPVIILRNRLMPGRKSKSSIKRVCMLLNSRDYRHDSRVIKEAKTLTNNGYEVAILDIKNMDTEDIEFKDGFKVVHLSVNPNELMALSYNLFLTKEAIRQKADVYHCHDLDTLLAGYIASRFNRSKLIYDSHELCLEQGALWSRWETFKWKALEKILIGRTNRVITVNDSIARELGRRYRINLPLTLMNCASFNFSKNGLDNNSDLKRICNGSKVILYLGYLLKDRNLERIIESAKYIKEGTIFLGEGPLEDKLKKMASDLNIFSRVKFIKPVPQEEVASVASTADIGIFPYKGFCMNYQFCTPNKLFEYLVAGLPVVASDLPELRKIVKDNNAGELFNPDDPKSIAMAINDILGNKERYNQMKENVKRIAREKYNWEMESMKLLNTYKELTEAS